jgi:putative molybdopterin biosynthesis protein
MNDDLKVAGRQQQFLDVISRDEATERFEAALSQASVGTESVTLIDALNRVLANDVQSPVDVTTFDRSNVDGFAVRAADTVAATEEKPQRLRLNDEVISPGRSPTSSVNERHATSIATGAMVPRGADAVVMVEDTDLVETEEGDFFVDICRPASPGEFVSHAGTDVAKGETVLRTFQRLTSREIGVLAALGLAEVEVLRRPRVAIISTGNEIVPPGQPLSPGTVYDSNAAILSAAVQELGCEPVILGIVNDDLIQLREIVGRALECDAVVMSGGTSKGAGDLSYQVVSEFDDPGIVAHGVALKPGKPVCLAVTRGKPFVVLPGFPTSAIFTFHEFVAPVLRKMAGQANQPLPDLNATLPMSVNSDRGRLEYLLVSLVRKDDALVAYPMGKGSGSVTTFSKADGFISIPQRTEIVEARTQVKVRLLSQQLEPADLIVIGSHCPGLDLLLSELSRRGVSCKTICIGSMAGLAAAQRGECDIAGIHLLDAETNEYNRPFTDQTVELINGYERQQGLVFRTDDSRFATTDPTEFLNITKQHPECRIVNRNAGSGTRILLDQLLQGHRPTGYAVQPGSHNAVVAAVVQNRADWGMAIESVVKASDGLGFLPVRRERYDFVVPVNRLERPAVRAFVELLHEPAMRERLHQIGCLGDRQNKTYQQNM